MVDEANGLIDDIAKLCSQITDSVNKGETPNDLLDQRDLLAERLCKLTGASVGSPSLDESDGDYKIDLNGKLLVQGGAQMCCKGTAIINTRHLVLVPMVGNSNYYDVQVENNQYDHVSDYSVATAVIERGATEPATCSKNGTHELFVERLSNGGTWMVGGSAGRRVVTKQEGPDAALGIEGSFSLEVGNAGVQAVSKSYAEEGGVVKNANDIPLVTEYEFRISAGGFETTMRFQYDGNAKNWLVYRDGSASVSNLPTDVISSPDGALTMKNIRDALSMYPQFATTFDAAGQSMTIEAANTEDMRGHLLSITDVKGTLAQDMGLANKNPSVEITVASTDSLQTIANKINGAYRTSDVNAQNTATGGEFIYATNPPGTAPSSPEQWLHANVVQEPDGTYYLALTSDVSGEANRINVMPGSVCAANGNYNVAQLLGFTDAGEKRSTSYMQTNSDPKSATTIAKDDVYVDDAYFIYDGKHFLSESNSFKDARIFKTTDALGNLVRWDNRMADKLGEFGTGVRLNLTGLNHYYTPQGLISDSEATIITVNPHVTSGEIYAMLEARDDLALGMEDYLDDISYELSMEMNAIHYSGHGTGDHENVTGNAFFGHITSRYGASRNLSLNDAIGDDLSLLAYASDDGGKNRGVGGDGSIAMMMAGMKNTKVFEDGSANFDDYFQLFVADFGSQGNVANYTLEAQQGVCDQIQSQRDAVMGVSTDEEMLDIIKFQQGVGAMSRYMTALDEMLDRIINSMGA
jgi:flagellar hook-associated protein 1 FlgK